ncbi:hypothetical protein JK358_36450 [Nocardia sp. 2]|uniref:Uncharacterized protein n=1 Tax=Nocardia acididurans TaxID=2802282 RepID=A0ABS1MGV6_9NOCA|nr:hypothetical protein [Nocardia acididurans]MBL1079902.1 hypothetical protein [Nocardia acididurans]
MTGHRQQRGHRRLHRTGCTALPARHGDDLKKRRAPIPVTRCPAGKLRYYVHTDAEVALTGMNRGNSARREQRSYQCPLCDGWHLTSWSLAKFASRATATQGVTVARGTLAVPATTVGLRPQLDFGTITVEMRAVPTPAEVAHRTVPIRRAELARSRAVNPPVQQHIRTGIRSRLHALLVRTIRRLRRA